MKHLRSLLPVFLASFLLLTLQTLPLSAQPGSRGGGGRFLETLTDTLSTRLSLTEEQADSVRAVVVAVQRQIARDREELQGDREAMMEIFRLRTDEMFERIASFLSEEQKEGLLRFREEWRERARSRFRNR
ncbi:MAG: hypothetical protein QHI48_03780 [Bacteroidota bacterium]|nr:hypothetical protein [Bacteroidota bacterium]